MKKLITLLVLSSVVFSGSVLAQDERPVRDGERVRDGQFRIPKVLRGEDSPIADALAEYRTSREALRAEIATLREGLEGADDDTVAGIRQQIRELMRSHAKDQRAFRKAVREQMRILRAERAGADAGE